MDYGDSLWLRERLWDHGRSRTPFFMEDSKNHPKHGLLGRFRNHDDQHADAANDDSDDDADACFITFKSPLVQEQLRPQWCDKFGWRDNWTLTRFLVQKMMPSKPCHMNRFPVHNALETVPHEQVSSASCTENRFIPNFDRFFGRNTSQMCGNA